MNESQHILLVEDNLYDAELSMISLKRSNLANPIDLVRDGEEALDYLCRRGRYAGEPPINVGLVLLDVRLPKIDGMEVLRNMKADDQLKHIPVVVLTGSPDERDFVESYKLGVQAYIQKPIDIKAFHMAIAQAGLRWYTRTNLPVNVARIS